MKTIQQIKNECVKHFIENGCTLWQARCLSWKLAEKAVCEIGTDDVKLVCIRILQIENGVR